METLNMRRGSAEEARYIRKGLGASYAVLYFKMMVELNLKMNRLLFNRMKIYNFNLDLEFNLSFENLLNDLTSIDNLAHK